MHLESAKKSFVEILITKIHGGGFKLSLCSHYDFSFQTLPATQILLEEMEHATLPLNVPPKGKFKSQL